MATRREFAKAASALAALAGTTPTLGGVNPEGRQDGFLDLAVWHTRLGHSAFPSWAASRARKLVRTGDDLMCLWVAEIEPLVRLRQARIAGLTPGYSAFVLGELARDHGYGLAWCLPVERVAGHWLADATAMPTEAGAHTCAVEINSAKPLCWMLAPAGIDFHAVAGGARA